MLSIKCGGYDRRHSLNQIYNFGWECAFASKKRKESNYSQIMPWVHCKDYLNEIVWSNLYSSSCNVYGMSYDPLTRPMSLDRTRVLVRDKLLAKGKLEKQCISANILLRDFDDILGFRKTVLKRVDMQGEKNIFIFESDKRWMVSSPVLSLFCLLSRAGRFCSKDFLGEPQKFVEYFVSDSFSANNKTEADNKIVNNDRRYLRVFLENGGFSKLLKNVPSLFYRKASDNFKYITSPTTPLTKTVATAYSIHNYGIVAFSKLDFPSLKSAIP